MGPHRNTVVVIPTKFQSRALVSLLGSILSDPVVFKVYIFDNGCSNEYKSILKELSKNPIIHVIDASNHSIYQMWNKGWKLAKSFGDKINVAILNDDCFFWPGTLSIMAQFLRSEDTLAVVYPDYDLSLGNNLDEHILRDSYSTAGEGGMAGFCFMLKGELDIPFIDEKFVWYYGDDDLVKQAELAGYKIKRIVGLPVEHFAQQSSRLLDREALAKTIRADEAHFNQKYNEHRNLGW